jgi:DNA-binding transcriptional MerR regulator
LNNAKTYSVSQLSKLAGVSVRTLHYYDQIGLLVPVRRKDNGYREYHQKHLVLLQQILIYREIDFSIEETKKLLNAEDFDLIVALESQKSTLLKRQENTASMIKSIETTMNTLKEKRNREILFEGIPTEKVEHWRKLAKEQATDEGFEKYLKWVGGSAKMKPEITIKRVMLLQAITKRFCIYRFTR